MPAAKPESTCRSPLNAAPTWMRQVLFAAGVYNLCWGFFAIVAPMAIFRWTGFDPLPLYPEIWQCVGMVVGVYGIGYLLAANKPFVHWPIVLVGLLGKVFGPIGFFYAVNQGRFPASMGWTILTNDLIWWIPFTMILWEAAKTHQATVHRITVKPPQRLLDPMGRMMSQFGSTLKELSRDQPLLLVFLRHSGCTFCRQTLSDLSEQRAGIETGGAKIAVVHMGQNEPEELLKKHELEDLHCFRDPQCSLYETFGLKTGGPLQLLGPKVWWRGFKAWLQGHSVGPIDGNLFRMPGAFLIMDGEVIRSYRHQSAADRPDYVSLSKLPSDSDRADDSTGPARATPVAV